MSTNQHQRIPPKVPTELSELDEAVRLLGNRANVADLRNKAKGRLVELLGTYPDIGTATVWKAALKDLMRDEIFRV